MHNIVVKMRCVRCGEGTLRVIELGDINSTETLRKTIDGKDYLQLPERYKRPLFITNCEKGKEHKARVFTMFTTNLSGDPWVSILGEIFEKGNFSNLYLCKYKEPIDILFIPTREEQRED